MAASNSSGGVLGKMISPQNLAIAAAAVGMNGKEGDIFRRVVMWSLVFLVLHVRAVRAAGLAGAVLDGAVVTTRSIDAVSILDSLVADLPDGMVVTDPAITEGYRQDRALDPSAGKPLAVVRPLTTEQVQTVMRWASAHRVPVVPRGAGSGLSGGATALDDCIVLSTEKMRDITVDPVTRTAVCQPGLFNAEVKKAVAEHDLWYPPDPSSFEICSIGGNIATNAGGLCCVKYGVTTDYVLGLQVVLADGTAVRLGGPRLKDVAGLSLTKLFVGSEGTLGIVTEVTLRLLPKQHRVQHGGRQLRHRRGGHRCRARRRLPDAAVDARVHGRRGDQRRRGQAARWASTATPPRCCSPPPTNAAASAAEDAEIIAGVFGENGATDVFSTDDPDEGEAFVAARRFAIPAVEAEGHAAARGCRRPAAATRRPRERRRAHRRRARRDDLGDRPRRRRQHPPADRVRPRRRRDGGARASGRSARSWIWPIGLGGTITGEHGVGRLKRPWLAGQIGPEAMELNRRIKQALDPEGILNPGAAI